MAAIDPKRTKKRSCSEAQALAAHCQQTLVEDVGCNRREDL
jgi:hypothetical protein